MLHLDDTNLFRDALGGIHGLDPAIRQAMASRFPDILKDREALRAEGEFGFEELGNQGTTVTAISLWAAEQRHRFDHLLVLGIGGSALGARALLTALKPAAWNEWDAGRRDGWPTLTVLDNADPVTITAALDRLDPRRTLVNVISKSGGTSETLAQYLVVRSWMEQAVGVEDARARLVFTTDPERGPLRAIARSEGITSFDVPPAVGGRFSVLTPVGLVPAALLGIDITALIRGAANAVTDARSDDFESNHAARWAAFQWQAQVRRAVNIHVLMPYSDRLREFTEWYRQLWAESLGKRVDRSGGEVFRGPTPVGAIGATDQHSQVQLFMEGPFDKTITFIRVRDTAQMLPIPGGTDLPPELAMLAGHSMGELLDAEFRATRAALTQSGRMNCTIELDTVDAEHLGELIMFFQLATGFAGLWYDVNPFDQPGVELGKVLTRAELG